MPPIRLTHLLTYIERDPDNLLLRKDAVREACNAGHWQAARTLIDVGLDKYPNDVELLAVSGFAHLQAQRYADAEQALSGAIAQGLEAFEPRYNLAFALFMQKRHEEALALLQPSLTQALPLAFLLRARCLHHLVRPFEAIADCQAHLAAVPDAVDTHGLLALLLYEQGRGQEAQLHINTALKHNPAQLEALLTQVSLHADAQDFANAHDLFRALLNAHPACGRGWLGLALVKMVQFQFAEAKQAIEQAATHMPDHIGTWHVLAWIHVLEGNAAAAERAFEQALALDRNFAESQGGLAIIAAMHGREDEARDGIRRALKLNPQSMAAQYAQLLLLQRQGQHDQAKALIEAALARPVGPGNGGLQYRHLVAAHLRRLGAGAQVVH